jgi:hypothetical protein
MKIGDLVRYTCPLTGEKLLGFINDVMSDPIVMFPVYEVICTEPYDRGWFEDVQLEVVNESQ